MSHIDDSGFDHSGCRGRNLPKCSVDPAHGHSAMFVGAENPNKGTDHVLFLCAPCMKAHMAHQMLGPLAVLVAGPPPVNDEVMDTKSISPDAAEQALLDVLAEVPDDESATEMLAEFRTVRAMVEARRAAEANVEVVQPMNAVEFGRLMSASPANPYRPNTDNKEGNN
jgi:hypothetical protein